MMIPIMIKTSICFRQKTLIGFLIVFMLVIQKIWGDMRRIIFAQHLKQTGTIKILWHRLHLLMKEFAGQEKYRLINTSQLSLLWILIYLNLSR